MNRQRRFALRSIYFHSLYGDDPDWPAELRPMPLDEAAKLLAGAEGPLETSRGRRAVGRLLASTQGTVIGDTPFRLAVLTIAPELEQHLDPAAPTGPGGGLLQSLGTGAPMVDTLEQLLGPSIPACERTEPRTTIDYDDQTQLISCRSTMKVRRPLARLRQVLDPQNWDVVMADYFREACVADCSYGHCIEHSDYSAACHSSPPAPGSVWSGVFYEHYELDIGRMFNLVKFKNLLDIRTLEIEGGYEMHYELNRVLYGKIGLMERFGEGLDRDDGHLRLRQLADGWTEVDAAKYFRLSGWTMLKKDLDPLLNWWTSVTIGETLDSGYEAVCMDP